MNLLKLTQKLLIILILKVTYSFSISPIPSNNKWFPRDITTDQGLHSLLVSIDDKLRGMDSIRFNINRLEMTFARMSSKIDSVESQLTTVQTSINIKMRELYEVLLKHDFHKEQMIQKCENSQSRLLHKINLLESRFEDSFNKLQGNSDVNLGKIDNRQNDIYNRVIEINSNIDVIRSYNYKLEDKINSTQNEIMEHFKNTQQQLAKKDHIDNIEDKINRLHSRLNNTEVIWTQNDSPKNTHLAQELIINDIKLELRSEAQKVGNKVSNMYNDIWNKISLLENLLKESINQTNITQKDLQDDLKQIFIDQRDNEGFLDIVVDRILAVIQSKFNDLHRRVENNFQSLITSQNEITGTCQRMQDDESEYWSKITLILEKLLDTFLNKSENLSKQNTELLEALKGHNSQMIRTVSDTKSMVITLAEENSHDHKDLDSSIHEIVKRADIIAATVEEIQDQFDDFNGTIFSNGNYFTNSTYKPVDNMISLNNLSESDQIENNTTESNGSNKTLNAIEANFNNGIIKIITDDAIVDDVIKDTDLIKSNGNVTVINLNTNMSKMDNNEKLIYLNNALSTSKIAGIISNGRGEIKMIINKEENTTINKQVELESKKENNSISDKLYNYNDNKLTITNENEDLETKFILSYINFIKGHITKEEFLQEGYPGKSFKNIKEMIAYMKPLKRIRNEFLRELDKYEREESESEISGRRHDFFDTTNFEYEDSSDEFMA